MAYQLDHRSQGTFAHASVSAWSTSASAVWSIEFEIEVFSLSSTIALGGATYAARVAQITTAGTVTCQNSSGGTVLTSAAGAITVGVNTIKVERTSDGLWQLTVNGVSVSVSSTAACAPMTYLANRVQNSYTNTNIAIRRVVTSGGAYSTSWDGTNAPSTGTTWTSSGGQVATLNNFTGLENSWWGFYNSITALPIPNNTLGAALNQPCALNLNNYFTGATSYSVLLGPLPVGLSIVGNEIVGTPTTAQSTTLVIRASNAIDMLDSATITFNTGLWYLRFTDTGWVDIPAFSALSTENWSFDLDFSVDAFPLSGIQGLLYHNSSNYVIVTTAGRINIQLPGIYINLSSFALSVNTRYLLSVVNTAGSGLAITINGTSVYSGAVRDVTFSSVVASSVSYRKVAGGIYKLSLVKGVGTRTYDPNTSGGVGNLLIDRVSNQNGTQAGTWPADDGEWVSYVPAGGVTNVRALLIKMGLIHQITDAEIGTNLKPLVLLDGTIKERVASEGQPLIYDPTIRGLRTISSNETLQI